MWKCKQSQSHYSPYCTCQLGTFWSAVRWLILTPGHLENWQKVTRKVLISQTENFHPHISIRKSVVADVVSPLSYLKLVMKERNLPFYMKDHRFWREKKRKKNLKSDQIFQVAQSFCNLSPQNSTNFASWVQIWCSVESAWNKDFQTVAELV